jgi:hypothetical protein
MYEPVSNEPIWLHADDFLPEDILYEIVSFLPAKDLFAAEQVSIDWAFACSHIKWIRILPEWKMKKLHPDATYDEKREYAKKEMKEFVIERNATKNRARIAKTINTINEKRYKYRPMIEKIIYCVIMILGTIQLVLLSQGNNSWMRTIAWLIYACVALNLGTDLSVTLDIRASHLREAIVIFGLSSLALYVGLIALEGSLAAWVIVLIALVVTMLVLTRGSIRPWLDTIFIWVAIVFLALYCCSYISMLFVVYIPLVPVAYKYYHSLNERSRSVIASYVALLIGQAMFSILHPRPISWLLHLSAIPFIYCAKYDVQERFYYLPA